MNCFQKGNYELLRDLAVVQVPVLLLRCLDRNSCCSAVLSCCSPAVSAVLCSGWGMRRRRRHSRCCCAWGTALTSPMGGAQQCPLAPSDCWNFPSSSLPQPLALPEHPASLALSCLKMQSTATATLGVQRGHSVYLWEQPVHSLTLVFRLLWPFAWSEWLLAPILLKLPTKSEEYFT